MNLLDVEIIFESKKEQILKKIHSDNNPIAVLLGGQPASGKSRLTDRVIENHPEKDFLVVNGDRFRVYHPEHEELLKNSLTYSKETQIFSNIFTEKLIAEAQKHRFNIIIEGTMRNKDVPLSTAKAFKDVGFMVEAYVISSPELFSEIGIYSRYQREVNSTGSGRLADINSHNEAVKGLLFSVDSLFRNNAVDKIAIYSFGAKNKIKEFNFDGKQWNCYSSPAEFIRQARETQLNDKLLLSERIDTGKETLQLIDKGLKSSVSQVLDKLQTAFNEISNGKQSSRKIE